MVKRAEGIQKDLNVHKKNNLCLFLSLINSVFLFDFAQIGEFKNLLSTEDLQ